MLAHQGNTPPSKLNLTVENLSQAIYVVNRHAKTAPNPKSLYHLKKEALNKLIGEGKAKKVGLHFSENPGNSQQRSDVLVECGNYTFHIPPVKSDFTDLPHLGKLDGLSRNPKSSLSLPMAKSLLQSYTGISSQEPESRRAHNHTKAFQKPIFKKLGERY
ncbi:YkyB family protein [Neobacillus terrae]|uniref:YkyB family protein n=1 Tax=Neobacillus terrae TaxID=3034837 RepID=UPI00140D6926|nr:YkyB family protein [Neobacillus terrae]NHM29599.1 hypothetical protein [Neobacillus terrae]